MTVLYCLVDLINSGGIERVTTDKLNAFSADGEINALVVTTSQCGRTNFFPLNQNIRHIDLGIPMGGAIKSINGIIFRLRALKKIKRSLENILIQEKVDICVFVARWDFLLFPFKKWKGVTILESHFFVNAKNVIPSKKRFFNKAKEFFVSFVHRQLRKRATAFVVLTKYERGLLSIREKNVYQCYNPCSFQRNESPLIEKCVVAVGRLTFLKGFSLLISAWKKVSQEFPDWRLEIWGEGELRKTLQQEINILGLSDNVFLKGRTSYIHEKYKNASVFVLSSISEGLGMVLLEAMSAGLPVVSFDCEAGPREIVEHNINGYLVPPRDTEELAESIKKVLRSSVDERLAMGRESLRIVKKFSPEIIITQWKKLFQQLMLGGKD